MSASSRSSGRRTFFDNSLINQIADAFEAFDRDINIRAYVLCSQGKSFCAGADFANRPQTGSAESGKHLYREATRLFRSKKPSIAAVQGAAIGGGLGLALMPDFRVACPEARFAANFTRLGFHPGFSLTFVLPHLIGQQKANLMFYTGRRIGGSRRSNGAGRRAGAARRVRKEAMELANEIAESSPLAVLSTRETMRRGFADRAESPPSTSWSSRTGSQDRGLQGRHQVLRERVPATGRAADVALLAGKGHRHRRCLRHWRGLFARPGARGRVGSHHRHRRPTRQGCRRADHQGGRQGALPAP